MRYREIKVGMRLQIVGCNKSRLPWEHLGLMYRKGIVVKKYKNKKNDPYHCPIMMVFSISASHAVKCHQGELKKPEDYRLCF